MDPTVAKMTSVVLMAAAESAERKLVRDESGNFFLPFFLHLFLGVGVGVGWGRWGRGEGGGGDRCSHPSKVCVAGGLRRAATKGRGAGENLQRKESLPAPHFFVTFSLFLSLSSAKIQYGAQTDVSPESKDRQLRRLQISKKIRTR